MLKYSAGLWEVLMFRVEMLSELLSISCIFCLRCESPCSPIMQAPCTVLEQFSNVIQGASKWVLLPWQSMTRYSRSVSIVLRTVWIKDPLFWCSSVNHTSQFSPPNLPSPINYTMLTQKSSQLQGPLTTQIFPFYCSWHSWTDFISQGCIFISQRISLRPLHFFICTFFIAVTLYSALFLFSFCTVVLLWFECNHI